MKQDINEITINGVVYVNKELVKTNEMATKVNNLPLVLIRSCAAGVHFGYLKDEQFTQSGKVVTLLNSRRIWYWEGANELNQVAMEGVKNPNNCKIGMESDTIEIVNVIETHQISKEAENNLKNVKIWKK